MSTKTIVEQLAEAQSAILALTTERDAFKASVEKLTCEKTAAEQAAQDAAKAKADAIALADKTAADLTAKLEAESAAKATAEKAQAETAAELAKIKAAVATNPAFADAAAKGATQVADVGRDAVKSMPHSEYRKLSPREQADLARSGVSLTSD